MRHKGDGPDYQRTPAEIVIINGRECIEMDAGNISDLLRDFPGKEKKSPPWIKDWDVNKGRSNG